MKKTIIIYGSQYGTTKLNAESKTILATYGKNEDFVDYNSLTAVMTAIV